MASFDASVDAGSWGTDARRLLAGASRGLLVALFALFAWSNFTHWRATGAPSGLGVTLLEGWAAVLFLTRRSPHELSSRPIAWLAAPIGSFAMLLARPTDGGLPHGACEAVQLAGLLIALASLGTLGRSFGIVAANRGVKTGGPYRLVRHPAYLGYLISYIGYVAENPSVANVALLCLSTAFQLVRIREEERLLASDAAYETYRRSVRYRLVPLLY
ncbi:MAG TPA: isoprenylcysteine carboxylmethyltransferase family protein [Gaiellaceae bacterium]|nr:isoprenylcysteine carboxylmethyltransferase family protein [Gaiellaceae bacterium]